MSENPYQQQPDVPPSTPYGGTTPGAPDHGLPGYAGPAYGDPAYEAGATPSGTVPGGQPDYGQPQGPAYGAPGAQPGYGQVPPGQQYGYAQPGPQGQPGYDPNFDPQAKSRLAAGLLGILIGSLGIHRFYLGYTGIGLTMLLVSVLSFGFAAPVIAIWGLVEGILYLTSKTGYYAVDSTGRPLRA